MVQELDNEGNLLQNAESISNRLDDVRSDFYILLVILLYNYKLLLVGSLYKLLVFFILYLKNIQNLKIRKK